MTFMNKILAYLGFCPSKESAQRFSVRNNTLTLKRKDYRDAIIPGICIGVLSTILFYILLGEVVWTYLIMFSTFYPILKLLKLYFNKRREAKKEEDVQRRE